MGDSGPVLRLAIPSLTLIWLTQQETLLFSGLVPLWLR